MDSFVEFLKYILFGFILLVTLYLSIRNASSKTKHDCLLDNPELVNDIRKNAPINWNKSRELADRYGIKAREIVMICVRHDIPYQKQGRVEKLKSRKIK